MDSVHKAIKEEIDMNLTDIDDNDGLVRNLDRGVRELRRLETQLQKPLSDSGSHTSRLGERIRDWTKRRQSILTAIAELNLVFCEMSEDVLLLLTLNPAMNFRLQDYSDQFNVTLPDLPTTRAFVDKAVFIATLGHFTERIAKLVPTSTLNSTTDAHTRALQIANRDLMSITGELMKLMNAVNLTNVRVVTHVTHGELYAGAGATPIYVHASYVDRMILTL